MKTIIAVVLLFVLSLTAQAQVGTASIHNPHGKERRTASGIVWHDDQMVAAHKKYPLGSYVRILDVQTKKYVDVEIIDRGPYVKNRVVDLSKVAANRLGLTPRKGILHVKVIKL